MAANDSFHYLACPFCGKSVLANRIKPSTLENFSIDWAILQAREQHAGPGRGNKVKGRDYGFTLIKEQCLTIEQMLATAQWHDLASRVIGRVQLIHSEYVKAGLIKKRALKLK